MRNCGDNGHAAFSKFFNSVNKIVNKHAPPRSLSKRKAKQFSKPWITKGIRKSIQVKNTLFASGNYEKYKHYRNKLLSLVRCSKKSYYHSFLCGLHEVYSRTMLRPDLFIYLFVYESREPVTWSSVYGAIVLLVRVIFSNDRVKS